MMTLPAGVIAYSYDEIDTQYVPFLTMEDMEDSLRFSLGEGNHDIDAITCHVQTESDANRLFAIMDAFAARHNCHGDRAHVYQLTEAAAACMPL